MKEIAPLLHAFDRTLYQDVVSQHLVDRYNFPTEVLDGLESGGSVANASGNSLIKMSIPLDKAHEMLINRETKLALARTTPDALSKLTGYSPYKATY